MKTAGGKDGRGIGNVLVTSGGKTKYEPQRGPVLTPNGWKPHYSCEDLLSGRDLRALSAAVRQSKPEKWKLAYVTAPFDQYHYDLELQIEGKEQVYKASWFGNGWDQLPEDLQKLSEAINQLMSVASKKCRGYK